MRPLAQPTWKILTVVVGISAALRLWAADGISTPWIAPDELIYADLARSFWQTGHFELFEEPVALFSVVYPVFAGIPLSLADRIAGYDLLKALQAVAMSLTAIPVYLWGRELVSRGWALVAAVLALALPSLAYSGLIMTEVAFYPVFILAAWALARAVEVPTLRRQAIALAGIVLVCATRLQAILFLPAYVTAVLLDAVAARDARRLRAHIPAAAALVVLALAWSAWQLRHGGPVTKVLGAYQAAGEAGYSFGPAARFVLYHLGDVVLICGVVPFFALVLLAVGAFRGVERDVPVRALVMTTLSLTAWMSLEVGVFASRAIGHLAERNLFPLVPLLLLALVVWLRRNAPVPLAAAAAAAALAVALLVLVPFETLTTIAATPSSFTQIPLLDLTPRVNLDLAIPLVAAVLLALCVVVSRRLLAVGVPLLLLALGIAASVSASRFIVSQSKIVRDLTLGPDRTWIDDHANGSVTFLFAGDLNWETPWQARFWNKRLDHAGGFLGTVIPGGLPAPSIGPNGDGTLVNDRTGVPIGGDYLVTSRFFSVAGDNIEQPVQDVVLWRTDQPIRLRSWLQFVAYDGSVPSGKARFFRYACEGGALTFTLMSPTPQTVSVVVNGVPATSVPLKPNVWRMVNVPVAKGAGDAACTVDFKAGASFVLHDVRLG